MGVFCLKRTIIKMFMDKMVTPFGKGCVEQPGPSFHVCVSLPTFAPELYQTKMTAL